MTYPIQPHEVFDPEEEVEFDDQHKHPVRDDWDDPTNFDCEHCGEVVETCCERGRSLGCMPWPAGTAP